MIPTIGRDVIVLGIESNGSGEQPAKITRAWSFRDTREGAVGVNLIVFPDAAMPTLRTSVMLFETRQEAMAYRGVNSLQIAAFWPERPPEPLDQAQAVASAERRVA